MSSSNCETVIEHLLEEDIKENSRTAVSFKLYLKKMHRVKGKRTCGMFLNTNLPTVLKKPAPNKKVRTELDMICTTNFSRRCLAFSRYVKNPIYRDTNADVNQEILAILKKDLKFSFSFYLLFKRMMLFGPTEVI